MFANGLVDNPLPTPAQNVSSSAHKSLAQEAALASTVLLTNRSSTLPLPASLTSLARR
ncbi:hypothetical protein P8A18_31780 [Streptomyces castrisilvae]|uniref:Uncharacterized protein n=1 Tax=Streptomyces castrisilvae TaxID=3033811 RepID=A0ABY9HT46_9ACTN|nr:hypothetical protein [Streptomyces sp. Mut1]WLQ37742.1 hypothetical protein P8A18_31780 [Streptomyces sp. Mut1]